MSEFDKVQTAVEFLRHRSGLRPRIAVVLGSGLGAFADQIANRQVVPYPEIPHFPRSTVQGHSGNLVLGEVGKVPVAVMQGRVHYYEGYSMQEVTFPTKVLARLGIRRLIFTNAAGGINKRFKPGRLMIIEDHLNLQSTNPLLGPNEDRFGLRFFDMSEAYDPRMRKVASAAARKLTLSVHRGIYAGLTGPSYETPAEIRMLRTLGADAVGMSTVPEVIVANHMGVKCLGISCITNMAAGVIKQKVNHEEVMLMGERVKGDFIRLLRAIIPRLEELDSQDQ
ncbi:MAG: purine-nucleoside phosphorylase [Acidobacteriia bacterium]|nr:purine-nucleoside phosphorylase [Terriglobia bacterium]